MAKKTKAADLSIEEKLEQALIVPGYEPYKIPDNWCWTSFKNVAEVVTGGTPSKKHKEYYGNVFPFFKPADLNTGRNVSIASEYLSEEGKKVSRVIPAKSTLVCCIGSIGKSGFLEIEGSTNQQINSAIPKIEPLYLYYYVNTDCFINQLWSKSSATTISIVNKTKMEECYFPLAPLPEQQRIVERIESLFSKLDEAKEKAQEAIDSFETRKAAILHKAFSGELTAKWREENGVGIESWERKRISECCKLGSGGTPSRKKPNYYIGDIPWIKTGEINWNTVNYSEESITKEAIDNSSAKVYAPGAVLVAMYGMGITRGKAAILGIEAATNQAVCVLQPKEYLFNRYLYFFFMCNYWDIREQAVGGNQLNLSATIIGKLNIDIPNLEEQYVITELLDSIIEKEYQTKQIAESVIDQIDAMKKAILARAFRGELGTNDHEEESAVELLKQILTGE
ncbi:restriction endonuclease subunit S [uncultured Ruminococcus sp.]|uniref:restriction endonuclease subunit S n=1 Tax=uncultured Ruminococcus sp. TaxID=165186 RepID=UPI0025FCBFB5|nr:restriction endonuclease subunit S [uncultured Ruminococcus sp.]